MRSFMGIPPGICRALWADARSGSRFHRPFTVVRDTRRCRVAATGAERGAVEFGVMAFLAIALFIALAAFGRDYFGWSDPSGQVQIALICSFIFGIIAGLKAKG